VLVNSDEKPALVPAETGQLLMGAPKPVPAGLELAPYEVAVYEEHVNSKEG